jgi:hypothetical protein
MEDNEPANDVWQNQKGINLARYAEWSSAEKKGWV